MSETRPQAPNNELIERRLGPVAAYFIINHLSEVENPAPDNIRQQWLGVRFPVREKLLNCSPDDKAVEPQEKQEEGPEVVQVYGEDAIAALRGVHHDAAARHWSVLGYSRAIFPIPAENGTLEPISPDNPDKEA